jgi:hypothetical protein
MCGEMRRYRPSDIYLGFPDHHLQQQQAINLREAGRAVGEHQRNTAIVFALYSPALPALILPFPCLNPAKTGPF